MKIKALNSTNHGKKLIIPHDGLIHIGSDGIVEVSENAAHSLVHGTKDWEYCDSEGGEQNELLSEDEKVIRGIKEMSVEAMKELAETAEYPAEEWSKFLDKPKASKLMAAYLIKKYNETKLKEEEKEDE